jgi:hypothetical protein
MKRIMFGLAACVLGLATAGAANAAHPGGSRGHAVRGPIGHERAVVRTIHQERTFRHSTFRTVQPHWGARVWSPVYHRYQYFDPRVQVYYYFDDSCGAYVPCE